MGPEIAEIEKENISRSGRQLKALRLTAEKLSCQVREQMSIYESIAVENHCWQMLSEAPLAEFQKRIMISVSASLSSLKSRTKREAIAGGPSNDYLLDERRYDNVRAELLTVVNIQMARLTAEGKASGYPPDEFSEQTRERSNDTRTEAGIEAPANRSGDKQNSRAGLWTVQAQRWEDIEITFLSDFRIQVKIGSEIQSPLTFAEMDFHSKKNVRTPVAAWVALRQLAECGGSLRAARDGRLWAVVEKRVQEIRSRFKTLFGLSDDPFTFTKRTRQNPDGAGYCAKFRILCHQSYGQE